MIIRVKQGDTAQKISDALTVNNVALDLSDPATTVALVFHDEAGLVTKRTASILDGGATGQVEYQLQTADVASVGLQLLEWEVTLPQGVIHIPSTEYISLHVLPALE